MKTHSIRRPNGFTLVELLVVIAIIAVLAGAGFAAGNAAIQKAKKTTAMATCTALESAVNNYYTEYGAMPTAATTDLPVVKTDNDTLLKVLLGLEGTTPTFNTRSIKFLSVKEGKRKTPGGMNGLIYNAAGTGVTGLYDPWGGVYNVMLDGDYNETLNGVKPKGSTTSVTLSGRRVAAWSDGADGTSTGTGTAADDVVTWNK